MSKPSKSGRLKQGYPSDVSDEEWDYCAPYLCLMRDDAPQRDYSLRDLFNALRSQIRARLPLAHDAQRPAALGSRLPTGPALDESRMF